MPSKTSLFNREIIKQDLRSVGWVGIVYFLGLFFALPLQLLMLQTNDNQYHYFRNMSESLFSVQFEIQTLFILILPVILGIFLFRYMQVKQSNDFIHSLPIKRSSLFVHHTLFGIASLIIPVILNGIIVAILRESLEMEMIFTFQDVLSWIGTVIVISIFLFISTVFVGMFTGLSVVQGILTFILLLLPAGLTAMVAYNLKEYLYGFPFDYYMNLEKLSIITRFIEIDRTLFTLKEAVIYLIIGVILYILSVIFYQKRKLEATSQAISYKGLRPVFKYGVTFCTMLFGGLYFGQVQDNFTWMLFGYVAGSFIGYFVAEMVLQKSWRVFSKWKGLVVYVVVTSAVIGIVQLDLFGYEKKLPALNDVEQIYFGNSFYSYVNPEKEIKYFKTEETMKHIHQLHQEFIKDKATKPGDYYKNISFVYELKNGKKFARQYQVPENIEKQMAAFKPILESKEYKEINNEPILNVNTNYIDKVTFNGRGLGGKSLTLADPKEIEEVITLIKQDIYDQSFDEIVSGRESWSDIELLLKDDERIHLAFEPSFAKTEKWLSEKDYLSRVKVMPEDVHFILVLKSDMSFRDATRTMDYQELLDKIKNDPNVLKISDMEQIERSLNSISRPYNSDYWVSVYYKGQDHSDINGFVEGEVPDFVIKHFEK